MSRVRPPNQSELSRDSTSAWDTPVYDDHIIKLAKGREGQREDKEWIFGEEQILRFMIGHMLISLWQIASFRLRAIT